MANEMRLIDANEVEEMAGAFADQASTKEAYAAFWKVIHNIRQMPAVDAVEVVHGRWIKSESMVRCAKCSNCKGWVTKHSVNEPDSKYCPNCGAKMDGERKSNESTDH